MQSTTSIITTGGLAAVDPTSSNMQGFSFKLATEYVSITDIIEQPEESNEKTLLFFLELLRKKQPN
jgi:hypothetical protein